MSIARKHFEKTLAAQQASPDETNQVRANANQYELMMAQLHAHIQTLKGVQSITTKCDLKAEFLADYQPYIEGVLESNAGTADDVLMTVMLWSIDAGNFNNALDIGEYSLKHKLEMPDKYNRSTACILIEEIATAALNATDEPIVSLEQLCRLSTLATNQDYPDQVKAKLDKALGYAYRAAEMPKLAIECLKNALALNPRAGVKQEIKALEKLLPISPNPASNTENKTETNTEASTS